ncbi:putative histidine kinase HHK12p [Melanomma pulvis-pyrius CBS 109.77]|uniref:Putative histidine kinase HHK12p n=1 Tax=Melanomma pulvis-pyrius CBS 109.77 TaxID=1314802 RepID=A0A6A6XFV1_9PLEO|nr:putative histidine kinase HHK12p [Melanomma pulvis-pyrius CBS 109.77]
METLYKLTAAGLPLFDINTEYLDRTDWSQTLLGPRDSWPVSLTCLVNSCLLPIPHPAAIFWGDDLAIVHNVAWDKATKSMGAQGARAVDNYPEEALISLHSSMRGRTVKVVCRFFLPNSPEYGPDATILLSTILDQNGTRRGVLAQLLHNLPLSGLDGLANRKEGHQTKSEGSQQPISYKDSPAQVDSKQTQLFQRFAELVPNGLAILDSDAEAVFVNDGFFKLTTRKISKDFRAWPESIDSRDYENVMSAYRKAFSSREELRVEFRCAGETAGEEGEWRLFLLRPLSEEPEAGFICAVVDITEIKQAQLTQEKAAMEAKDRKEQQERFIDMVSHEIRNPLSAVLHLAEEVKEVARDLSSKRDDIDDEVSDILDAADTILLCVSHQNTLIQDILSFSKLDSMMLSLVPREVQPKWEFSKSLRVFNSEFKAKDIKFHYAMDVSYDEKEVDYVVADLNRMTQVLVNLITNAIKFTAKKRGERKITVSMGASNERPTSYPPNVIYFGQEEKDFHMDSTMSSDWGGGSAFYLMVAVKDTGIGINVQDQEKLFERFRQATPKTQENYGGSGLGLFISRKLCQLHGGDVGVSSKHGEGSTFGFFFKVRHSDGSSQGGRPPFGTRTTSESSVTAPPRSQTPRPSYSRSGSALGNIKERPEAESRISHRGVDPDAVDDSLKDPPTELRDESHPASSEDARYRETQYVAERIKSKRSSVTSSIESKISDFHSGETARQAVVSQSISASQSHQESNTNCTILLVEDNLINQKVLRRQLQSRGFEVFVANNGQEAVDAVEERGRIAQIQPNRRNYFDCILMDQEMPLMDGNTATTEIRELQAQGKAGKSPILGVSANVREAQTESMLEAGMDSIISKPYKVDDLVQKITDLLPNR